MEHTKIPFWKRIQFHAVSILVIILFLNRYISRGILTGIEMTEIELGFFAVFLNNFMSIMTATLLISLFLRYYVLKPIEKMEQTIHKFENGQIEERIATKKFNEIGVLAARLNKMFDGIANHQSNQLSQINLVETKSNVISEKIETLTRDLQSVNDYFKEVANTSSEQLSSFEETSAVTENMNNEFQSISDVISEVTTSFNSMKKQTETGGEKIKQSSEAMAQIANNSKNAKDVVTQLTNEISKIKDVVTLINDISEQTNLLALNASIEAARAGEHGKGFSIVAEEVRKLAERSVGATEQITATVETILQDVDAFNKSTDDRAQNITEEANKILTINEAFEDLAEKIVNNIKVIDNINTHTKEVAASSIEIASTMDEMTNKTERSTEEVIRLDEVLTEQMKKVESVRQEVAELNASFKN